MSENIFLGDATYPHTPAKTTIECEDFLNLMQAYRHAKKSFKADEYLILDAYLAVIDYVDAKAADRIEQLERELAEAQKGHARYEYVRKLNAQQFKEIFICNLAGVIRFDDLIDQSIEDEK